MNVCDTISVHEVAGVSELAGATDGQAWLVKARCLLDQMGSGVCTVDFAQIRLATVSWLREAVLALNRYVRSMRPDIVIVMTNLQPLVLEELQVALGATGQVAVIDAGTSGTPAQLVGPLDPALRETFKAIEGHSEFDASLICKALTNVGPSAANNRLAALESKGIFVSERRGRNRIYRTVLENLRYGN